VFHREEKDRIARCVPCLETRGILIIIFCLGAERLPVTAKPRR
jgi:hypothetical protein